MISPEMELLLRLPEPGKKCCSSIKNFATFEQRPI
jgi:hypothetical protein